MVILKRTKLKVKKLSKKQIIIISSVLLVIILIIVLLSSKEPTRDGYVFKGWVDKNETPIYNKVLRAEDTTLYAVWEK